MPLRGTLSRHVLIHPQGAPGAMSKRTSARNCTGRAGRNTKRSGAIPVCPEFCVGRQPVSSKEATLPRQGKILNSSYAWFPVRACSCCKQHTHAQVLVHACCVVRLFAHSFTVPHLHPPGCDGNLRLNQNCNKNHRLSQNAVPR